MTLFDNRTIRFFTRPIETLMEIGVEKLTQKITRSVQSSADRFVDPNFQVGRDGKFTFSEKARFHSRAMILAFKGNFQEMGQGIVKFFGEDRRIFVDRFSKNTHGSPTALPTFLFANLTYFIGRSCNDSTSSIGTGLAMMIYGRSSEDKWLGTAALLGGVGGIAGLISGAPSRSVTPSNLIPPTIVNNSRAAALTGVPQSLSVVSSTSVATGVGTTGLTSVMASKMIRDRGGSAGKEAEKNVENKDTKKIDKATPEYPPIHSDEVLATVLQKHGGNRNAAAKELGYANGSTIVIRIKRAKPGSTLEPFKEIKGKRGGHRIPDISDETLATVLQKHGGNQRATAKELGYTYQNVNYRIKSAKTGSTLEPFKNIKGHRIPAISDETLATVLQKHGGNRSIAAKELGYSDSSAVNGRILKAKAGSPLEPFKEIKGNRGSIPEVSDETLATVLQKHGGSQSAAAKELGYTHQNVSKRIKKAKAGSPLEPFKEIKGKRGGHRIPAISDETLATVLQKHGGNRSTAAKELGYSNSSPVNGRILKAKAGSPLEPFKEIKGSIPDISDETLATVLRKHGGNQKAAAKELGYTPQNISKRIKKAKAGSPLEPFKEIKGKRGGHRIPAISDETLATVLRKHGGNQKAAAKELGYTPQNVNDRIKRAKPGSPLEPFKEIKGKRGRRRISDVFK
jgi:predicted transcriptional regulator